MSATALCTEDEITRLVHDFYGRVREDEALGPIFDAHISNWDRHLGVMVDFWSALLLHTGRFAGAPMPKHAVLPGLTAELFQQWIALFRETTAAQPNQAMARQALSFAERIAQSLWMGYQARRRPGGIPSTLVYD